MTPLPMYRIVRTLLFLAVFCAASRLHAQTAASCSLTDTTGPLPLNDPASYPTPPTTRIITLENPRILVRIAPEIDGNIAAFIDKSTKKNPFSRLDDKFESTGQWKPQPFTCKIDQSGPDRAAVTLSTTGDLTPNPTPDDPHPVPIPLLLVKTISIDAHSSILRIDVSLTNKGDHAIPRLRYMVHALYSYKVLPGSNVYAYIPQKNTVQLIDHEAIVKNNYVARISGDHHPFKRWSLPGQTIPKARYPAEGWAAMYSDSGHQYIFYDPAQFDFISLWSGTHPAEWLVMEPNAKGIDLQPGQTTSLSYSLASDSKDVPFTENTVSLAASEVPEYATPGAPLDLGFRLATVRDRPENLDVTFSVSKKNDQHGSSSASYNDTVTVKPFLFSDDFIHHSFPTEGMYEWKLQTTAHLRDIASGEIEILSAQDLEKRLTARAVPAAAPDQPGAFPPAAYTNPVGMQFLRIPAGSFVMGSAPTDPQAQPDEQPHQVRITHAFLMAKYEVTNAQFRQFQPDYHNQADPFNLILKGSDDADDQPAKTTHNVVDAEAFLAWLNDHDPNKPAGWTYRLPTEAEWEYAARGPHSLRYPWGNTWDSSKCDFGDMRDAQDNLAALPPGTAIPILGPRPVGSFSPQGDSPFGIADMAGGLWEWCLDTYDLNFYAHSPVDDPVNLTIPSEKDNLIGEGSEKIQRVLRGGSYTSLPVACRSAYRFVPNSTHNPTDGIRVVLAPTNPAPPH